MACLTVEEIGNVVFVKIPMTLFEKHFSSEVWKSIDMVKWVITKHYEILWLEENGDAVGIRIPTKRKWKLEKHLSSEWFRNSEYVNMVNYNETKLYKILYKHRMATSYRHVNRVQ